MTGSALYHGVVTHHRRRQVVHALRYRIFLLALDLDEAPSLTRRLRWFAFDQRGLLTFWQRDHGDGTPRGLRPWIDAQLAAAGLHGGGPVTVLSMPRVLGHAFNPLTLYFCHARDGALQAMLYEVNNTFGQRHSYLLPVHGDVTQLSQSCGKAFHVSPFMDMDLSYQFRVSLPGERIGVFITASDEAGVVLAAGFTGRRQALSDASLLRAVLGMPLQGAKVVLGIHWEAMKLWVKGLKLRPAPPSPAASVTIGS
jgi:DUF1365 family protein